MAEAASAPVAPAQPAPAAPAEVPAVAPAEAPKPLPTNPQARRRAILEAAKTAVTQKEAEVKAARNGKPAVPEVSPVLEPGAPANDKPPEAPAAPAPDQLSDQLSNENMKWLRSEMMRDPAAFATLQELLKYKTLPEAFISLKKQKGDVAKKTRDAERIIEEKRQWETERNEWETLKREKPLEAAKKLGLTIRQLAEAEAGAEPEEKRQLRAATERLEALEKKIDEREQAEQQRQEQATINDAVRDMGSKYAATKELYPNLARFESKAKKLNPGYDVGQNAWNYMVREHKETGIELDLAHVLSTFEDEAAAFFEDEQPRPPVEKTPGPSERGNGAVKPAIPAAPVEAPTPLSSKLTAERGGPAPPATNRREIVSRAWAAAQQAARGKS